MVAVLDPVQPSPTVRHAILKSYRASDKSLPILALRKELMHRGDLLHYIHPRKLEQLVSCLSLVRLPRKLQGDCVREMGDGGVDVILLESNRPIAIQVKRRERPDKSERVSCIREFIAAMQLNDYYEGMYVTTAENFSSAASREAELAVGKRLIMKCELIDKGRLLDMIGATSRNPVRPWKKHLEQVLAW
jgi:restriction system protein